MANTSKGTPSTSDGGGHSFPTRLCSAAHNQLERSNAGRGAAAGPGRAAGTTAAGGLTSGVAGMGARSGVCIGERGELQAPGLSEVSLSDLSGVQTMGSAEVAARSSPVLQLPM
eukprot:CAMPEP_0181201636 /NCGR_PEP_ID=MMETSP1096-20121128/18413_1 /TAXON_ID=156174 ORGANISM="Chrysochromulina ericina, Strain CCMP281" /NCGR_SAMPLE_ID=MMETSP1096 /ASSEMBLY_ACC=CAM_ASM_000453 /LENGTH=113 /DNA_ID=CAMNT_0023292093 /DNA_START=648 /DNA_END=990 /DNA_ORIENTATION=+